MLPDDYLNNVDSALSRTLTPDDHDAAAAAQRAEAQIMAIQAVAAAINRLAVAVENLSIR